MSAVGVTEFRAQEIIGVYRRYSSCIAVVGVEGAGFIASSAGPCTCTPIQFQYILTNKKNILSPFLATPWRHGKVNYQRQIRKGSQLDELVKNKSQLRSIPKGSM